MSKYNLPLPTVIFAYISWNKKCFTMTTNVRDSLGQLLATDSRWTWDLRPYGYPGQLLLDDGGYEKLLTANGHAWMFAGSSLVIDQWKLAIKAASLGKPFTPFETLPVNGMAIGVIGLGTGNNVFISGHEIFIEADQVSFAGTGSFHAAGCWVGNRCAKTAVETAKTGDPHTGGTVRYHHYISGENNLTADQSLSSMFPQFLSRSLVMTTANANPTSVQIVPFAKVAANEADAIKAVAAKAQAHGSFPSAPCDAVYNSWPEEERLKLVKAVEAIFS